jgi:ferredoxin
LEHAVSNLDKTVTVQNDEDALFHSIICDEEKCTQCLACLNECKIGALSADPSSLTLSWSGSLCTGCTACVDICPENALSTGMQAVISQAYFHPAIAAQAEPMRCKQCGKIFGTKKSFDRVMEILAREKMDHDGHFEFCEDCRVIKLLESE